MVKNKKFLILPAIILLVLLYVIINKMYDKGCFIPSYFTWNEKIIEVEDARNEFIKDYDIDFSDVEIKKPITKLVLKNKKVFAFNNNEIIWEENNNYKVQDMLWCDIDKDNENELLLILWKKGRYGSFMPFFIKNNDMLWDQHIFIYDYYNGNMKSLWKSSYIEVDIKKVIFDENKILNIIDKKGNRTRFSWISWGLANIKSSKFDYDKNIDKIESEISINAFGDNLIHQDIYEYALKKKNNYNFLYDNISKELENANINIINQETVFVDKESEYSTYPKFGSPVEIGEAMVDAGFNVVCLANNHILDKSEYGLNTTLDFYKKNKNVTVLGVAKENEDRYKIIEVNGIKIALFNYAKNINELSPHEAKQSGINVLSDEKMVMRDLDEGIPKADVSIVCVHWGIEYNEDLAPCQKKWSKIFLEKGVDIVIGTHPHILQKNELIKDDKGNEMYVYYSLGNLIANQPFIETIYGGEAKINILKTNNGIKINKCDMNKLIIHQENDYVTVFKEDEYPESFLKKHNKRKLIEEKEEEKINEKNEKNIENEK